MAAINKSLKLLMNLTKINAILSRRFDRLSVHGISFNDFMILYLLSQHSDEKMRRVDLAEKIGLTSSGVTRMLVPMEKTGLVKREASQRDARVSYVMLTPAGRLVFEEALVTAGYLSQEIISAEKIKKTIGLAEIVAELGGDIA